jgi:pimeloyl-ACP methyl ester carboxylesterase
MQDLASCKIWRHARSGTLQDRAEPEDFMGKTTFLDTPQGRRIAYHFTPGDGPCVVFLGGLKSDMEGTKALFLEDWARAQGRAFLRFDYSGHGQSSGTFEQGCIGDWAEDTVAAVTALTPGPLVVVGSSMGGWQALLLARAMPERIAGMVTIAAAPDFTEDGYWASFTDAQKHELDRVGHVALPSDYMEPYIITKRMIEDGRRHLVLRTHLSLPFPVRCLQGTADTAVSTQTALRLLEHADCPDMRLTLVKDADHRFSDGPCLDLIAAAVQELTGRDA